MPDVSASSVSPTCTVPLMVGAPVAGLLGSFEPVSSGLSSSSGPGRVAVPPSDNIFPSPVQIPPPSHD